MPEINFNENERFFWADDDTIYDTETDLTYPLWSEVECRTKIVERLENHDWNAGFKSIERFLLSVVKDRCQRMVTLWESGDIPKAIQVQANLIRYIRIFEEVLGNA